MFAEEDLERFPAVVRDADLERAEIGRFERIDGQQGVVDVVLRDEDALRAHEDSFGKRRTKREPGTVS